MAALAGLFYLLAAVLFIVGIKRLASPRSARSGNGLAAGGMLVAIAVTLVDQQVVSFSGILIGVAIGALIGSVMARTVQMTGMPQMVALFNGFGGGASALVATAEYLRRGDTAPLDGMISIILSVIIGAVTVSGSFVAWGKLEERITGRPVTFPLQKPINALILAGMVALAAMLIGGGGVAVAPFLILVGLALLLGVLSVLPIGGADMPVVICLLNSYSGLAASFTGFAIDNHGLIISGALVGASGIILTQIMCKAMNRSLGNVLFGAFGAAATGGDGDGGSQGTIKELQAEDAAMLLAYSQSVVVVPGYGLAVSQAQHQVRELCELLEKQGTDVKYAIHPVAGRMPGHMNVLLAEANVPYEQLWEMERINSEFEHTDVSLVIGANDVVNPAARSDTNSPIYGMPILDVDHSKAVIIMKRSMNPGFAGIQNALFFDPKTSMLFGDAKASLTKLISEVKSAQSL